MTELAIDDLLAAMPVDPEAHLAEDRVLYYLAQPRDEIEPVVVFRTPDGLLLADGYHRLAAARRRGAATIPADTRSGSRADALYYAARAGAAQRGITTQDALDHIERWRLDGPGESD